MKYLLLNFIVLSFSIVHYDDTIIVKLESIRIDLYRIFFAFVKECLTPWKKNKVVYLMMSNISIQHLPISHNQIWPLVGRHWQIGQSL